MREAVIVSTARTPIGKAFRGAFNDTDAPVLSGHAVREAVRRAGVDGAEVEDLVLGCAIQQGTQGYNIARLTVATSGLAESVAGMSIDRNALPASWRSRPPPNRSSRMAWRWWSPAVWSRSV